MFRDSKKPISKSMPVNCLIKDGGLGDLICSLVAVNYLIKNSPWLNVLVWVPDYMLEFTKHVLPNETIVRNYTDAHKKYNDQLPGITTGWTSNHTPMKTHAVDYSFHMLCDMHPKPEDRYYLSIRAEEIDISKFIHKGVQWVCVPVGYTNNSKEFKPEVVNKLTDYLNQKGYTPVFIGKDESPCGYKDLGIKARFDEKIDFTKGIDLRNKTSLLETAAIIAKSKCVVGMEGGLVHLAGFTEVPIVAAYTFADPVIFGPIRKDNKFYPITQPESLACRYCQTSWTMLYNHDFFKCYYDDYQCVKNITAEKFIEQLEKVL